MNGPVDIAIVGGGINGCGIARDAAGRGLSVHLCEMNDLASGTSSWSTKLIHGGLRYLEYNEFRLVREALIEREVLWGLAPHIIRPLRFVLPHRAGMRPLWLLRTGLFLYDHLGGRRKLAPTCKLDLTRDEAGKPLRQGQFESGFEYSDCFVDDARLVVLNAISARDLGAQIETRTRAASARVIDGLWHVDVEPSGWWSESYDPSPCADQCGRPMGRRCARARHRKQSPREGPPRARLPHRRSQALRT